MLCSCTRPEACWWGRRSWLTSHRLHWDGGGTLAAWDKAARHCIPNHCTLHAAVILHSAYLLCGFRKKIYEGYKANRQEADADFKDDLTNLRRILEALQLPVSDSGQG
jgi:hypothetical protein